jgi:hypothetical protein
VKVVLIQPLAEDLEMMGPNLMSTRRRHEVIEVAMRTVAEQLRTHEHRELLADLPGGAPHKLARPSGPPSTWPALRPAVEGA